MLNYLENTLGYVVLPEDQLEWESNDLTQIKNKYVKRE